MSKYLLMAVPLVAAVAVPANAQAPAPAAPQQLPTRTEVATKLDEGFKRVDTNHDGFLNREEITAAGAKAVAQAQESVDEKVQEEFKKLDTDKNGQLSLAEFRAAAKVGTKASPEEALQRLDTNKDGRISAAEFKANTLASYDKVDANHDGKITQDEAAKAAQSR
jgi:Ca2+-binding EF-hand superfamily protein